MYFCLRHGVVAPLLARLGLFGLSPSVPNDVALRCRGQVRLGFGLSLYLAIARYNTRLTRSSSHRNMMSGVRRFPRSSRLRVYLFIRIFSLPSPGFLRGEGGLGRIAKGQFLSSFVILYVSLVTLYMHLDIYIFFPLHIIRDTYFMPSYVSLPYGFYLQHFLRHNCHGAVNPVFQQDSYSIF